MGKIDQEDDIDGAPIDDDKNGSEDGECPDEDDDDKFAFFLFLKSHFKVRLAYLFLL